MKLYKYYRPTEHSFENLERNQLCFNDLGVFTDKAEGKVKIGASIDYKNIIEKILRNVIMSHASEIRSDVIRFKYRVLSLTESVYNKYLWDNYSSNNSGFCLEYNYEDLTLKSDYVGRCKYFFNKDQDYTIDENDIETAEIVSKEVELLFSKFINSDYNNSEMHTDEEKEFRCVRIAPKIEIEVDEFCKMPDCNFLYIDDKINKRFYKSPKRILVYVKPTCIFAGYHMLV